METLPTKFDGLRSKKTSKRFPEPSNCALFHKFRLNCLVWRRLKCNTHERAFESFRSTRQNKRNLLTHHHRGVVVNGKFSAFVVVAVDGVTTPINRIKLNYADKLNFVAQKRDCGEFIFLSSFDLQMWVQSRNGGNVAGC